MKILVVNCPSFSHNIPTLGFITELIRRGFSVDIISSSFLFPDPALKDMIISTGANYIDCEFLEVYQTSNEEIDNYDPVGAFMAAICIFALEHAEKNGYNAIVYDFFMFPVYYFNHLVKTPVIRFYSSWAYNKELYDRMFKSDEKDHMFNKWFVNMQNTIMSVLKKKNYKFNMDNIRDEMIDNIPPLNLVGLMKDMQPCTGDFDERFVYVGTSVFPSEENITIPFERMEGRKVIYVSFGTFVNITEDNKGKDLFERIINTFRNEDVFVIMAIGTGMPIEDLSCIPDNFFVYQFVPQTKVLQHADLIITHGGMNSVNEAIYYGVPMVVIPGGQDQSINAEQVELKNIGKSLDRKSFTTEQLCIISRDVLYNDEIKHNITEMQNKARSLDSAIQTANLIEDFIKQNK